MEYPIFKVKQNGVTVQELLDAIPEKADKSDTYTKEQTDGLLDTKADNGTTLADYGITDAYTKDEVDDRIADLEEAVGTGGSVDERIAAEAAARANADTALGNRMTTLEGSVDDRLDQQDAAIGLLDGHKLEVVDVLPTEQEPAVTPESDVIYRLVVDDGEGNISYDDYMYNEDDLTTPIKIANYPLPGIDEEPTAGSRKLAESGGIAKVYGSYKDDEEWVYCITDKDNKFIFGIKNDGSIEWSVGVPIPIQELVNSIVIGTDGVSLDGLNKIATFLNDFSTEDSLKALLDAKVNTEEGKGLIPSQYIEEVDNNEMLQQILDAAGHVIESTHVDGTKEINWNLKVGGDFETPNRKESTEDSGYYVKVLLDANNKLIIGVGGDGDVVFGKVPSQIQRLLDEKEDKGANPNRKIVRLLSIGNSYSDDALAYVPFILQNMGIDVDLQIGILMRSSASLQNHVDNFNYTKSGDTERGNVYGFRLNTGGNSWQVSPERSPNDNPDDNQNGVSIQWALDNYEWDIICLQQSSQGAFTWNTYQPYCNQLINLISNYIDYPIKFIWYMPQARPAISNSGANWSDEVINEHYENTAGAANRILNETCCEYVVPVGTAIQNARTMITLKALGDYANNSLNTSGFGYLTPNDGVHLQEGLPCQIAAYTFVLAILYLYGFEEHSIIGESTRVTSAWLNGKNIPSPHGTPIGSTDENCLIAQMCAIMALKHPFEVTDMRYIVNPE